VSVNSLDNPHVAHKITDRSLINIPLIGFPASLAIGYVEQLGERKDSSLTYILDSVRYI
jgi:hypothetical protein